MLPNYYIHALTSNAFHLNNSEIRPHSQEQEKARQNISRHVISKDGDSERRNLFWEEKEQAAVFKRMGEEPSYKKKEAAMEIPGLDVVSDSSSTSSSSDSSDESSEHQDDFWGYTYISWFSKNILETKQFEAFVKNACPPSVANNLTELPLRFLHCLANGDKHAVRCSPKQGSEAKQLLMYVGLYKSLKNGMDELCENLGMENILENEQGSKKVTSRASASTSGLRKVIDYNETFEKKSPKVVEKSAKDADIFPVNDFKITVVTSNVTSPPLKQIKVINTTPQDGSTLAEVQTSTKRLESKSTPTRIKVSQTTNLKAISSSFPLQNVARVSALDTFYRFKFVICWL